MKLSFNEMGQMRKGAGLAEIIKSSDLDLVNLKYSLDKWRFQVNIQIQGKKMGWRQEFSSCQMVLKTMGLDAITQEVNKMEH